MESAARSCARAVPRLMTAVNSALAAPHPSGMAVVVPGLHKVISRKRQSLATPPAQQPRYRTTVGSLTLFFHWKPTRSARAHQLAFAGEALSRGRTADVGGRGIGTIAIDHAWGDCSLTYRDCPPDLTNRSSDMIRGGKSRIGDDTRCNYPSEQNGLRKRRLDVDYGDHRDGRRHQSSRGQANGNSQRNGLQRSQVTPCRRIAPGNKNKKSYRCGKHLPAVELIDF